jgi:multiple sugar transport system ATP-binding protein
MSGGREGQKVVLGVRPEQITLRVAEGGNVQRGTVNVVEPMGADTIVWLSWNGRSLAARVFGDFPGRVGDMVGFNLDLGRASLFDAQTGERLGTS